MPLRSHIRRVLLALVLVTLGAFAYPSYLTARAVVAALSHAEMTAAWLAQPIAETPDHQPINRAQVIDELIRRELARPKFDDAKTDQTAFGQ